MDWTIAQRPAPSWAVSQRAAPSWTVTTTLQGVDGFNMALYGTPIAYYSMAETALGDGASVSRFEELLGTGPVMDAPSGSEEGTYEAATSSVLFDGSDHYEPTSGGSAFDTLHQTAGTIAVRYYNDNATSFEALFGSSNSGSKVGLTLWRRSNTIRFILSNGSSAVYNASSSAVVSAGWVNAIWAWDGTSVMFWVEGVAAGTTASGGSLSGAVAGSNYEIGRTGGTWTFGERIAKVLIWSDKITSAGSIADIQTELAA
jgi:hypothetical protein